MIDPQITIDLRNMAANRVAMTMRWRELLFLHFPCPPQEIQEQLPKGLTVDTFPDETGEEKAWMGLVPFRMEGVRSRGFPHIRQCEDFPETNVRTYCHREGRDPGVWFFSLDAANPFACAFARRFFSLNYRHAQMKVERLGDGLDYHSRRCGECEIVSDVEASAGDPVGAAMPGTLEFFLVERYLLYSEKAGRLYKGQVFHPPYQLRRVESYEASSGLIVANGLVPRPFVHAIFSEGVDVAAGRIVPVE